jgi:acyl transferase domain-containing protein
VQGGFLEDVDGFDPDFFGITPKEAAHLDPQQRLLLEVAWEALEHAGQAADRLAGTRTGVFVGISTQDYSRLALDGRRPPDAYTGTGNASSVAANRLSYLLDLRGPSLAVDTACSSSLVAVHLACQSLRRGECGLALAAGVNLMLAPDLTQIFSRAGMMSPSGRCHTFDAAADGYVRGEGCGVVVLKPLSKALQEGDRVWAVVRGSAVSQDGRTNGLTAPSGQAQRAVVREALARAGVAAHEVGYVEAHGTGTPLGDPIEVEALQGVLLEGRDRRQRCAVGAVKTNIGHLEAAAGIAGLIKAVLVLAEETIPPNLNFTRLNPSIRLDDSPIVVPAEASPWPRARERRVAGVSSFGFGGTNCHLVLEEAPADGDAAEASASVELLALSAASEPALRTLAGRYAAFIARSPELGLSDLCFTTRAGRPHLPHRVALWARTRETLARRLADVAAGRSTRNLLWGPPEPQTAVPRVVFVIPGEGARGIVELWRSWGIDAAAVVTAASAEQLTEAVETLRRRGHSVFLEIAPRPVLSRLARRRWPDALWLCSGGAGRWDVTLRSLAALYVLGASIDWAAFGPAGRRKVPLPTHPFRRERHWLPTPPADRGAVSSRWTSESHPLLGQRLEPLAHAPGDHTWEGEMGVRQASLFNAHRLRGTPLVPLAAYLEIAQAAARQALGSGRYAVTDLRLQRPLTISAAGPPRLQVSLVPEPDGTAAFAVHSQAPREAGAPAVWTLHATARIRRGGRSRDAVSPQSDPPCASG